MKKNFKFYAIIWAIALALFNVISFVSPEKLGEADKYTENFWAGYILITVAFIGQLACGYKAFSAETKSKFFLNVSILSVSYSSLITTLIVGSIFMFIPALPHWFGIIVCMIVLAFSAVAVVKAIAVSEAVDNIDKKIKVQTYFIKSLTSDAETLIALAKTDDAKQECKKVYEAARYSDPMSNDALASSEAQISLKFNELRTAVNADNIEAIKEAANMVLILLTDRNNKCKLLK